MSTLKVNTITNVAGQINVGKVVTIAKYTDYTNVNTTSGSYSVAYTFPSFAKKYDAATSSIFGFCSICTLQEGNEQQSWKIDRGGTLIVEMRHKNASLSGWTQNNSFLNFNDGAPAGSVIYTLQFQCVTAGYYNYPTAYGNGVSHYTLMEVLN